MNAKHLPQLPESARVAGLGDQVRHAGLPQPSMRPALLGDDAGQALGSDYILGQLNARSHPGGAVILHGYATFANVSVELLERQHGGSR